MAGGALLQARPARHTLSQAELARLYNVTRQTIRKWQDRQDRDSPVDGSHRPGVRDTALDTTLTPEQALIVMALRTVLLLPTDDLRSVTREFINPAVSRTGPGRFMLARTRRTS